MSYTENASKRKDIILALGLFLGGLGLYARTLVPGLLPGDSGEFQTLAALLGHTHPTGYPVYLVLAHPFTRLPLRDVAYRVNLFSAVMAALTVAGVYLAGRGLTRYRAAALASAVVLAFSPTFWSQALIAEVYTPGAAFFIAVLGVLLAWSRTRRHELLFVAGLLGGLSLGVHMTVALLAPAVLLFLLLEVGKDHRAWGMAVAGALLGVAMTLALFAWVDARDAPADYFRLVVGPSAGAWDLQPEDVDGVWERLRFDWTAQQFRPFMGRWDVLSKQAGWYVRHLPGEIGVPMLVAALVGLLGLLWARPRVGGFLLTALAVQWLFVFTYAIWDLYVFCIPGYILLLLLGAAGLDTVVRGAARWGHERGGAVVASALLLLVILTLPFLSQARTAVVHGETPSFPFEEYPEYDAHLHERARGLVTHLPQNAILLTDWDMLWPYAYVAYLEENRPDLTFIETRPRDDRPEIAHSLVNYVRARMGDHPIFLDERENRFRREGFRLVPMRVGGTRLYRLKR